MKGKKKKKERRRKKEEKEEKEWGIHIKVGINKGRTVESCIQIKIVSTAAE